MNIEGVEKVPTGTPGLDHVLHVGFLSGRAAKAVGGLELASRFSPSSFSRRTGRGPTSGSRSANPRLSTRLGLRGDDSQFQLPRERHALCRYLKRMGVTVVLVEEIRNGSGEFTPTEQQTSYLADTIVFLRYLEVEGSIEKAIGVLKKRYGGFDRTLHELSFDTDGLHVGEQLRGFRGLLQGIVEPVDDA